MVVEPAILPSATERRWVIDPVRGLSVAMPAGLMGVLNATPDSFSDAGYHSDPEAARSTARVMVGAGVDWLDVGGESTRPGALPVPAEEERRRIVPVIRAVAGLGRPVSIDTTKAVVAEAALDAGAAMINDVSAGRDPEMFPLIATRRCPVVLMHLRGTPATMQDAPHYGDVVGEVIAALSTRMQAAVAAGIAESAILLDPGIGFGKTVAHNLALLRALPRIFEETGRPLVVGISRKSFLASVADPGSTPDRRDGIGHVAHGILAAHCALLRVHDVPGAATALRLAAALRGAGI